MSNADYVAIAITPALIMALIGSLVFFLIEVLYVGSYEARLTYVFALFVFATVLIARIAIEFGAERAAMFSLPLGGLTYLALLRFVEHPTPFSWLINLALLALVWWCAHKLTWDCTVIDDNEDASGEGLLGRVGLDGPDRTPGTPGAAAAAGNELLANDGGAGRESLSWWRRLAGASQGPHAPGLWVLYFSLAALPLFGIGQRWIPASDVGRRRYAFGLLSVYVAAGLSLLVTTSFLGLRRYLRQRNVEMPAPMAATWVALGAALIFVVMLLAALLPRPAAEYALARPPWQAAAPGDRESSERSIGEEGTVDPEADERVTSEQANAPQDEGEARETAPPDADQADGETSQQGNASPQREGEQSPDASEGEPSDNPPTEQSSEEASSAEAGEPSSDSSSTGPSNEPPPEQRDSSDQSSSDDANPETATTPDEQHEPSTSEDAQSRESQPDGSPELAELAQRKELQLGALQGVMSSIVDLIKFVVYGLLALVIAYFAWKYRNELLNAVAELVRDIRAWLARLFGGKSTAAHEAAESTAVPLPRRRSFAEYRDPFASGVYQQTAPAELVRYTFEAFEAWAGDHGRQRTHDQTPQELVRSVLPTQSPMYAEARRMAELYGEAAYSAASVSRESAASLKSLWHMMRQQSHAALTC